MAIFFIGIAIFQFLLMLTFLVVIHELGHFISARIFKIKIEEFGIGYPPLARTLFRWKGIPFTLNWIPVGGFVRMEGENGDQQAEANPQAKATASTSAFTPFYTKTRWQRLIVILAGAAVNFAFGVLAFAFIYSRIGIPMSSSTPQTVVMAVYEGPAAAAGIQANDKLIRATDSAGEVFTIGPSVPFTTWVKARPDSDVTLTIERAKETKDIVVHTRKADEVAKLGALSVQLAEPLVPTFYPWYRMPFESAKFGLVRSLEFSKLILSSLGNMGSDLFGKGKVPTDVAGPIGIVGEVVNQKIFEGGMLQTLDFTAMFSINLAIMNILPIPALDGGRAVFILLEYIVGRKRVAAIEYHANAFGFGLLITLILLISFKDMWNILR